MPHSDEPLNPPTIQFRSLRAGEWLDFRYHIADVHDGAVIVAFDLDGHFDTAEIEKFGRKLRTQRLVEARKERARRVSSCNPDPER